MGMAGGVSLPKPIPLETIRREGERLGYDREDLEDFVEIIRRVDDTHVEVSMKRIAAELKTSADRAKQTRKR